MSGMVTTPWRTRSGLQGRQHEIFGTGEGHGRQRSTNDLSHACLLQLNQPQMGSSPNRSIQYSAGVFSIPAMISSTRNENR
jgi:hypothetical protein